MPAYKGEHEEQLRPFVDAMRYKLANNKYRGQRRWETDSVETLLERLSHEIDELKEAIAGGNTSEILMEAADIGNFAMMVATVAIQRAAKGHGGKSEWTMKTRDPMPEYLKTEAAMNPTDKGLDALLQGVGHD